MAPPHKDSLATQLGNGRSYSIAMLQQPQNCEGSVHFGALSSLKISLDEGPARNGSKTPVVVSRRTGYVRGRVDGFQVLE